MKDALAIHRTLLAEGTHHEIVRLRRLVTRADELPEALGLPRERCLAVRMYQVDGGRLAAVIVRAGEVPPERVLLTALGACDIKPAAPDIVNAVTDYAAGLVAPLLLPASVTVLMDRKIVDFDDDVVYAPTGDAGTAVGIHATGVFMLSGAKPVDLAAQEVEPTKS